HPTGKPTLAHSSTAKKYRNYIKLAPLYSTQRQAMRMQPPPPTSNRNSSSYYHPIENQNSIQKPSLLQNSTETSLKNATCMRAL
ncbi:hypothetical protein NPIL_136241, partial [Nephila pilipes]